MFDSEKLCHLSEMVAVKCVLSLEVRNWNGKGGKFTSFSTDMLLKLFVVFFHSYNQTVRLVLVL
jgi:hypothetical protein